MSKKLEISLFITGVLVGLSLVEAKAIEISEKLSLEANLTFVHQWLDRSKGNFKSLDRGSGVLEARFSFKPTEVDEFSLRASFAKGNGLKKVSPFFFISPNADDLRDDLHNINGRSRDHLQELWYARTFNLPGKFTLRGTIGIIDSTAFVDDNRFANDELTQFMNEVFVNNPVANLVSYDYGVAFELGKGPIAFKILGMQSKTEDKKNYDYYVSQIGYRWETALGEGNLRVYAFTTNKKFLDWKEQKREAKRGWGVSFDQDLMKERLGVFARIGFQDDKVRVDYKSVYSFGASLKLPFLGKKSPTFGMGYAYLKAPSKHEELKNTEAFETYLAIPVCEVEKKLSSVLTFDWQYIRDKIKEEPSEQRGHLWGVRLNIAF